MKIHLLGIRSTVPFYWLMLNARFLSQTSFGIGHWWYLVCSASKLPREFPGTSKKDVGRGKNCKNAFKCNLKELTTKKAYSASLPRSVTMHLPSSSLYLSCDSMACGVSFVQHYPVIRFFFQLIFRPSLSPYSFFTDTFQCDGCQPVSRPLFVGSHGWVVLLWQPWGRYSI